MDITNNVSGMLLVERDTGAIVVDGISPGDKVRIIRAEQIWAKQRLERENVSVNEGRKFVKVFPSAAAALCDRLSPNALWVMHRLLPYVRINSGALRHCNGVYLKRKDIVQMCAPVLSERTADRAVSELCDRGVLAKGEVNERRAFFVNPYVVNNGSRAPQEVVNIFANTEWAKFERD